MHRLYNSLFPLWVYHDQSPGPCSRQEATLNRMLFPHRALYTCAHSDWDIWDINTSEPSIHMFGVWEEARKPGKAHADMGKICKLHTDEGPCQELIVCYQCCIEKSLKTGICCTYYFNYFSLNYPCISLVQDQVQPCSFLWLRATRRVSHCPWRACNSLMDGMPWLNVCLTNMKWTCANNLTWLPN